MSNLKEHEAEQAAITAMCEAGTCDHPECQTTPDLEGERTDDEYLCEIVDRCAPRWVWEIIDRKLATDANSTRLHPKVREIVSAALEAMIDACETGSCDQPARYEPAVAGYRTEDEPTFQITITPTEHATILAALRVYQECGQGEPDNRSDAIHDIATNGGDVISLDDAGIDDLCEALN